MKNCFDKCSKRIYNEYNEIEWAENACPISNVMDILLKDGCVMYKIVRKKELNDAVTLMEIEAPFVAKKAKAGQFIIFRIDEQSERVPLTIAGYDREKGTVTLFSRRLVSPPRLWAR